MTREEWINNIFMAHRSSIYIHHINYTKYFNYIMCKKNNYIHYTNNIMFILAVTLGDEL